MRPPAAIQAENALCAEGRLRANPLHQDTTPEPTPIIDHQPPSGLISTLTLIEMKDLQKSQYGTKAHLTQKPDKEHSPKRDQSPPGPHPHTPPQSWETSSQCWETAPESWGNETVYHTPFDREPMGRMLFTKERKHSRADLSDEKCLERANQPRRKKKKIAVAAPSIVPTSHDLFQSAFDEAVGVFLPGTNPIHAMQLLVDTAQNPKPTPDSFLLIYRDGKMIVPLDDLDPRSPSYGEAESAYRFKSRLTNVLRQMMYVSGETAEPSVETTSIIEDIVRQQVIELVSIPVDSGAIIVY